MEISFRNYSEDYLDELLSLENFVNKTNFDTLFWNWRFNENPYGKFVSKHAFDGQKLVATYLAHPLDLRINQTTYRALFSMWTTTHTDYMGKGIMKKLANQVYDYASKEGFDIIIGFPNDNSRFMFTKKLGFKELGHVDEISCTSNIPPPKLSFEYSNFSRFDNEISNFLMKSDSLGEFSIFIPRTLDFLNWRFIKNPLDKYYFFKLTKNDKIIGFFILKNYANKKCHIVDYYLETKKEVFDSVIHVTLNFAKDNNLSEISLWAKPGSSFHRYLTSSGFVIKKNLPFIIKILSSIPEDSINFEKWFLTMADSDVY